MDISIFGIAGVAAITVICYLIGHGVKASGLDNKWIPVIVGACGGDVSHGEFTCRGCADRGGSGDCQRPCGHRRGSGRQAAFLQMREEQFYEKDSFGI